MTTTTAHKVFHGWIVVGAVFVVTLVGFGSAYTFSSFVGSLQDAFGASRGSVSLVFSIAGFLYFSLGIISGPLADRWGARPLAIAGTILIGSGLILASQAHSIAQVYVAYSVGIGVGIGLAYVPALGAVQRWFIKRRGFASGLAVSGIGVGTLIMPPLATWLITVTGWRSAYLWLGIGSALIGVTASFLIEDDPRRRGLQPDGEYAVTKVVTARPAGVAVKEAIWTGRFLGLYASCLIGAFGVFVPFVHLVPYAIDHQIVSSSAVLLLGAIGVGGTVSRLFLGEIADRIGRDVFLVSMYAGMAGSLLIWFASSAFWSLAMFALLFGTLYGGWVAVLPAVVADHFGGRHISGIIGALYTSVAIGTLVGPSAAGFMFDSSHSYLVPIAYCAAANAAAAVIAVLTIRTASPFRKRDCLTPGHP